MTGAKEEMSPRDILSEPLVGWRAWHVVYEYSLPVLVSWSLNTAWPARRKLEAACEQHGPRPHRDHDCGIHAFKSRDDALAYAGCLPYEGLSFVRAMEGRACVAVGRVSLWGRVVAHRGGYRAQFAYPYELFLIDGDQGIARDLARRYAVEVSDEPGRLAA